MGLATGLETLCGQAYGAKRFLLLGVYLQSSILVTLAILVPIVIVWFNMERILLAIGQDPEISRLAALYLRYIWPGLLSCALTQPLVKFLQSQSLVMPMFVCSLITAILHPFVCWTFIHGLGFGFIGGALSTMASYWFLCIILFSYTIFSGKCGENPAPHARLFQALVYV